MKLTAKVRLYPSTEQEELLKATLTEANAACNQIAAWAWEKKTFGQYKIHHGTYHTLKANSNLSAQVIVRCIAKVCDSYKLDNKRFRQFKPLGSIAYDSRILTWKFDKQIVSIWTLEGRQKIAYKTGEHYQKLLQYQQGESDLSYIKGKWYLHATCDVADDKEQLSNDILGIDLGITNIATDDSGKSYEGKSLNQLRSKRQKVRSSLQSKGTRGAKKVLKRISGREKTTSKIVNHTIASAIVAKAKEEQKAIALEELKGIRPKTNKRLRKWQRGLHNRWSFYQLRQFIEYKAKREGVQVITIPAAYTSKTCSSCLHIGNRSGESFKCTNRSHGGCGNSEHADVNAAKNIRSWGQVIACPEESALFCEYVSFVGHVRQV